MYNNEQCVIGEVEINFVVERKDSSLVPWDILVNQSTCEIKKYEFSEQLMLFETGGWGLPIEPEEAKPGDIFRIKGRIRIDGYRYWTDYGYEYDENIEWLHWNVRKK